MKQITLPLKQALKEIGFDRTESQVFCCLLGRGMSSIQEIAKEIKLPRSSVHLAVGSLVQRGVILVSKYGKRRTFYIDSPEKILRYVSFDEKNIQARKALAEQILPELKAYSVLVKEVEPIEIEELSGEDGFVKIFYASLEGNHKEVLRLGGNPEKFTVAREKLAEYRKKRTQKGIQAKIIMPDSSLTEDEKRDAIGKQREVRSLPKELYDPEVQASIFGDKIAFTVWDKGLHSIMIKNSKIATLLKSLYSIAWKQAK